MTQASVKLTFEKYLTYDDGTDLRYELVDGELLPMTPASPRHSDLAEFIYDILKAEVRRLGLDKKVKLGDVGVRTGFRKSRLPDVSVIDGDAWRSILNESSAVLQAPLLLAVEIVSPGEESVKRDYVEKKVEYAQIGIPEYWIVDPLENKVSVLVLTNGDYQATEFRDDERVVSALFPELNVTAFEVLNP